MGALLSIETMQEIARSKGGECLSSQYFGAHIKLRWRCAKGHEWDAKPNYIKNLGTWCPFCAGKARRTIEEMKEIAIQRGGECLSENYVNAFTKLRWRCAKGHEWKAAAAYVKNRNSWCPTCSPDVVASKLSLGLEEMHELAKIRGGECLSKDYPRGRNEKIRWRCQDGHEWNPLPPQ